MGWRQFFLPAVVVLSGPLLWLSLHQISDSDPLGYYQCLKLPQGVPQLLTQDHISTAYTTIEGALKQDLQTCADDCELVQGRIDQITVAFHVLTDPKRRARYDHPAQFDKKDFYKILSVSRDATLEDMRAAYKRISADIARRRTKLGCADGAERADGADGAKRDGSNPPSKACAKLEEEGANLMEAVNVLGNPDNRRVYLNEGDPAQGLEFVTNPLKMVSTDHPWTFWGALAVLLGVLYYVRVVEWGNTASMGDPSVGRDNDHQD